MPKIFHSRIESSRKWWENKKFFLKKSSLFHHPSCFSIVFGFSIFVLTADWNVFSPLLFAIYCFSFISFSICLSFNCRTIFTEKKFFFHSFYYKTIHSFRMANLYCFSFVNLKLFFSPYSLLFCRAFPSLLSEWYSGIVIIIAIMECSFQWEF